MWNTPSARADGYGKKPKLSPKGTAGDEFGSHPALVNIELEGDDKLPPSLGNKIRARITIKQLRHSTRAQNFRSHQQNQ